MLDLGPKYQLDILRVPPHMSTEDYQLFKRWRSVYAADNPAVYYDVGIGPEADTPPAADATIKTMWTRLNQKRLDVLLDLGDRWIIVELRDRANANAVGRLLQYQQLWEDDAPDVRPLQLELVSNRLDRAMVPLTTKFQILYRIV